MHTHARTHIHTDTHTHTRTRTHSQLTLANCEYHGRCTHDHSDYPPALIMKLRLYISKLSKADTRLFCAPGVRCSLDNELLGRALAAGTGLSNRRLHVGWRLEKPDILEARLNDALTADGGRVQAPLESECQESCQMFVCFAIEKTAQWFNQPKQGIASRTSPMTQKTDRVFEVDPEYGNAALERPAEKSRMVTNWLDQMALEHLIMPKAEFTVLPFKTKREAHAMFVLDTEQKVCVDGGLAGRELVIRSF
jgi:hypothetical protein